MDSKTEVKACTLAEKRCVPCRSGTPPLAGEELLKFEQELGAGWREVEGHHLEKEFAFKNFAQALAFVDRVGALAEQEGHHPDILLSWGRVRVTLFTHKAGGLTENDFILAAKIELLERT
jgi:4a-hydroxytetrahydrobiopterin dehydratase